MANYTLNEIEVTKYEIISQQDGKHYLRLHFNDLDRSFATGEEDRIDYFKALDATGWIDISKSNRFQIETKALSAAQLKKTAQILLEHINAGNRVQEAENARREEERKDLLLAIGAVMGDIPREEEE